MACSKILGDVMMLKSKVIAFCDKCIDTGWVENICNEYPWASGGLITCSCEKGQQEDQAYQEAMIEAMLEPMKKFNHIEKLVNSGNFYISPKLYHIVYYSNQKPYPMSDLVKVFKLHRDDVVNLDKTKLENTLSLLRIRYDYADEESHFQIQEMLLK